MQTPTLVSSSCLTDELGRVLAEHAGPGIAVGARRIESVHIAALHPVERRAVANAVAGRQSEFATGRLLLHELIGSADPIGVRGDRTPNLPAGVVGSLAHDRRYAIAATTRRSDVVSLGIDIEPTSELEPALRDVIVRHDEGDLDAHLAFTLKEAAYKAWSGLGGDMLDHHDVKVQVETESFRAEVVGRGAVLNGTYAMVGDRWVALVIVRHRQCPAESA